MSTGPQIMNEGEQDVPAAGGFPFNWWHWAGRPIPASEQMVTEPAGGPANGGAAIPDFSGLLVPPSFLGFFGASGHRVPAPV